MPSSTRESTASITSSIFEYRSVHGRTYQSSKTTEYWASNDEKHIESFDVAHQWMTMMLDDKLYAAPIGDNPQRILDIGTGTGIWAIDMADQFPSAEIDDAQLNWTFEPNSFDFIHVRFMHGAIDDWPRLYRQMYRCLKPGGWFRHMEPDIAARCGNPKVRVWKQWTQLFYAAGEKLGRTFRLNNIRMEKAARDAGFIDMTHRIFNIPYGHWTKDKELKQLGQYAGLYLDLSLDGFALFLIGEVLGWSFEEVEVLVAKMRAVVRNPNNWVNSDM
ncbi:S-adenosyl-L-methionine-dependent methyltransferase [Thelonectria olida]|uniref:S-adenosyl-L-methionine-dependent methyltransferase n=1 Tax=Thelonectria olida TaxID=1576542 RepID=A0A9P8VP19_9HYPO|nr:S-adenosyl-L-methionine-dependent methyltransferase [Thelonectria olida]